MPILLDEVGDLTGELLGTPNAEMRGNLSGDQPKLIEPWMVMSEAVPAK